MRRRDVLKSTLAGAAALAAPNIVRAESQRVLKFLPQADLATLDPVWTTADVTRNHAHLVFDTLYGQDNNFQPQPQMAAGHTVGADGRQWDITLRDGLKFHDGSAGAGARLCGQHPALVAARRVRRRAARGDRRGVGAVRQADPLPAEEAVPAAGGCARGHHQHVLHHAGAPGADRCDEAGERDGRLRPVSLRRRRSGLPGRAWCTSGSPTMCRAPTARPR